jgi:transporter family-2 protein
VTKFPYILAAIGLGGLIALQPALNADVARRIGTPVGATFLSILVSFSLSAIYMLAMRQTLPLAALPTLPWYLWFGGVIGFIFVIGALWVAPVLGGALLFAAIVLGQMIAAVVADHFGVGGYPVQGLDPWRIGGIVLVLAGVLMFQRSL